MHFFHNRISQNTVFPNNFSHSMRSFVENTNFFAKSNLFWLWLAFHWFKNGNLIASKLIFPPETIVMSFLSEWQKETLKLRICKSAAKLAQENMLPDICDKFRKKKSLTNVVYMKLLTKVTYISKLNRCLYHGKSTAI